MTSDMLAGKPPAIRPTNLVGPFECLWEILSWCWAHDPLLRPHAAVLSTYVTEILSIMDSAERRISDYSEKSCQPLSWSPRTSFKDSKGTEISGEMLVDYGVSTPTPPDPKPSYGHYKVSDQEPTFGAISLVAHGDRTRKQGDEDNNDNNCVDVDVLSSDALYEDRTQIFSLAPITIVGATPEVDMALNSPKSNLLDPSTWPHAAQHVSVEEKDSNGMAFRFRSTVEDRPHLMESITNWNAGQDWNAQTRFDDQAMGSFSMYSPIRPSGHHFNEYYNNPRSSDWWDSAAELSPQSKSPISPLWRLKSHGAM
jgi:hypothetical protein